MRNFSRQLRRAIRATLLLTAFAATAHAQQSADISFPLGASIEVGIDSAMNQPTFSWILTQDGSFQGAQRGKFFSMQPPVAGTYTLEVSIQDATQTRSEYRAFTIQVTDSIGTVPAPAPGFSSGITLFPDIAPVPANGIVSVPPAGGFVKIDLSRSIGNIVQYAIDVDGSVDSNLDGNPANDNDTAGTTFEQRGSGLYYFFLPRIPVRSVTTMAFGTDNSTARNQFSVDFMGTANPISTAHPVDIIETANNGNVQFTASIPNTIDTNTLLYEWTFGDTARSLENAPAHLYAESGFYDITVQVRDITNGSVLFAGSKRISVSVPVVIEPSDDSGEAPVEAGSFGSILKVVLIIIGILALAVSAFFLIFRLKNKASGSFQKKIEQMEEKLFEKDAQQAATPEVITMQTATPLTLKRETKVIDASKTPPAQVSEQEKRRDEFKPAGATIEVPTKDAGPVPPWLNGSKPATAPQSTPAVPLASKPAEPKPVVPPAPLSSRPIESKPATLPKPIVAPIQAASPTPTPTAPITPSTVQPAPTPIVAPIKKPDPVVPPAPSTPPITPKIDRALDETGLPDTQISEAERERRRKKRQRYRENKKLREKETKVTANQSSTLISEIPQKSGIPAPMTTQSSSPVSPKPVEEKSTQPKEESDAPIAIIRIDSLGKEGDIPPAEPTASGF